MPLETTTTQPGHVFHAEVRYVLDEPSCLHQATLTTMLNTQTLYCDSQVSDLGNTER